MNELEQLHAELAKRPRKRRLAPLLIGTALLLLVLDQVFLRVALSDGVLAGSLVAPFDATLTTNAGNLDDTGLELDERFGWRATSKPVVNAPFGSQHVVIVGGSRAFDTGEATWAAQVGSTTEQLHVTNLAVPHYGIDQAWMVARADGLALEPDEVWLCLEPDTALFATTSYLPLVARETSVRLAKPRFRAIGSDDIELVPFAGTGPEHLGEILRSDPWAHGECLFGLLSIPGLGESFAMSRVWITWRIDQRLQRARSLAESSSRKLLAAIVATASRESTNIGARFRVIVLPGPEDFERAVYWTGLIDDLRSFGIEVIDVTAALAANADESLWTEDGSYTNRAHAIVSRTVAGVMQDD